MKARVVFSEALMDSPAVINENKKESKSSTRQILAFGEKIKIRF